MSAKARMAQGGVILLSLKSSPGIKSDVKPDVKKEKIYIRPKGISRS